MTLRLKRRNSRLLADPRLAQIEDPYLAQVHQPLFFFVSVYCFTRASALNEAFIYQKLRLFAVHINHL